MKLLLIDDEPGFISTLTRVLTRMGVKVYSASSPDAAVDILGSISPDVVLVDLLLGGHIDGADLVDSLRKMGNQSLYILMTGMPPGQLGKSAAITSDTLVLHKPFTPDELLDLIRRNLGGSPQSPVRHSTGESMSVSPCPA